MILIDFLKRYVIKPILSLYGLAISILFPIRKKLIVFWSFNGNQYGGNPRCISEYIQHHSDQYDIVWLKSRASKTAFPKIVRSLKLHSLTQIYYMNVAEFLVTDCRTNPASMSWHKRSQQKYIMTWHGGMGIKKVEKDAIDTLPANYIKTAKSDSKIADLFLSGSGFLTKLYRKSFWYDGEILQKGIPMYDLYFDAQKVAQQNTEIRRILNIGNDAMIVLYAPTFRSDFSLEPYRIDWNVISEILSKKYRKEVFILLKLHPHFLSKQIDTESLISNRHVINVTSQGDITSLICASDMLITDYSATMFEMALVKKPVFLYAVDVKEYDRDFYFNFKDLPFALAESQEELAMNIESFDPKIYQSNLNRFMQEDIEINETGMASKAVFEWIKSHSL